MGITFIENDSVSDPANVSASELSKVSVDMYMTPATCHMCTTNMLLICSMNLKVKSDGLIDN